jgi:hypothetical protein
VKQLPPRQNVPKTCETRLVQLNSTVYIQLMNNGCKYFAPHSVTVTILCDENESVEAVLQRIGKLRVNSECKEFTTSVLLQATFTVMCNVTFKLGDLLKQGRAVA